MKINPFRKFRFVIRVMEQSFLIHLIAVKQNSRIKQPDKNDSSYPAQGTRQSGFSRRRHGLVRHPGWLPNKPRKILSVILPFPSGRCPETSVSGQL
jgi:hypothetical protein